MQRQYSVINRALVIVFATLILITTALSWHTFVVKEDFRIVTNTVDVPYILDLSTY